MTINQDLEDLFSLKFWRLSQQEALPAGLKSEPLSDGGDWLLACQHLRQPPLSEQELKIVRRSLSVEMPNQLQELLQVTNGAELFCIEQVDGWGETNLLSRINLLNGFEILRSHVEHLSTYLAYIEDTSELKLLPWQLNYLAFVDMFDGNFLAIALEDERVFFLNHEFAYYPIGHESQDPEWQYNHVADSLADWLKLIVKTQGQQGLGKTNSPDEMNTT